MAGIWAVLAATAAVAAQDNAADDRVQWTCPTPVETNLTYYPSLALSRGKEGFAYIDCLVAPAGTVIACTLDSETPPNFGFGEKALHIGCFFRFPPASDPGAPPRWVKHKIVKFKVR